MNIEEIRLTPEEHWEVREKHYKETSEVLGEALEVAIANTATGKAIKKMIELVELYGTWNENQYDEYWGYLCLEPEEWQALKKLVEGGK